MVELCRLGFQTFTELHIWTQRFNPCRDHCRNEAQKPNSVPTESMIVFLLILMRAVLGSIILPAPVYSFSSENVVLFFE